MNEQIVKTFWNWTMLKIRLHLSKGIEASYFHEGQIWWASLGKNIGYEMDGKHEQFHRPVLVLKKYNANMCFVLPLTTMVKHPSVWYQVKVSGARIRAANITQGRVISAKRLWKKQDAISGVELAIIRKLFADQFF